METINQVNNFQNSENETAQNFNGANIKNLNNYYPIFNPKIQIELKNPQKIYFFKLLKNENIKKILFITFLPLSIFIVVAIQNLNIYKFLQILLASYIILGICLFIFNFLYMFYCSFKGLINKTNKYNNYILIDKEKIEIVEGKETKIINFQDIGKIEIERNYIIGFGYDILIYNKQLKQTLTYNVFFREDAFLIKELFEEYLLKIPNDKTLETIKDTRANKNTTKVSL